jgi:hypothetical protein
MLAAVVQTWELGAGGTADAKSVVMSNVDLHATLQHLQSTAAEQVAQWPQYTGHFASYKLVRLKCEVKTKAGLAFKRNEYAIGVPYRDELPGLPSSGKFATVWSRRNKVDTSVRVTEVEWL